jgi:hypothetical protein
MGFTVDENKHVMGRNEGSVIEYTNRIIGASNVQHDKLNIKEKSCEFFNRINPGSDKIKQPQPSS